MHVDVICSSCIAHAGMHALPDCRHPTAKCIMHSIRHNCKDSHQRSSASSQKGGWLPSWAQLPTHRQSQLSSRWFRADVQTAKNKLLTFLTPAGAAAGRLFRCLRRQSRNRVIGTVCTNRGCGDRNETPSRALSSIAAAAYHFGIAPDVGAAQCSVNETTCAALVWLNAAASGSRCTY